MERLIKRREDWMTFYAEVLSNLTFSFTLKIYLKDYTVGDDKTWWHNDLTSDPFTYETKRRPHTEVVNESGILIPKLFTYLI